MSFIVCRPEPVHFSMGVLENHLILWSHRCVYHIGCISRWCGFIWLLIWVYERACSSHIVWKYTRESLCWGLVISCTVSLMPLPFLAVMQFRINIFSLTYVLCPRGLIHMQHFAKSCNSVTPTLAVFSFWSDWVEAGRVRKVRGGRC